MDNPLYFGWMSYRILVVILAIALFSSKGWSQQTSLPNIVLLVADDLGYGELGCQGNTDIPTPHIDRLAANGVRFTSGYVCNAYCSPSRAGFLTGRYPNRFGYETNMVGHLNEDPDLGLPPEEVTIPEYLLEAGYVSGLIGKWHLGGTAKYHPYRQGFDEFFGFLHEGHYFVPPPYQGVTTMLRRQVLPGGGQGSWTSSDGRLIYSTHMGHNEPDYDANNPILRGSQPVAERQYLTDAITREAVSFVERHQEVPFFLYVAYNAVHSPLQGAEAYMYEFRHIEDIHRRIFAAMLSNLDDSVGEIVGALRALGLEENTLIVFLSDNGGPTRELTSSNLPLRGGKGQYYEGGIRVPFIMQWKRELPAGQTFTEPVIALDLLPTFLGAARGRVGDDTDGVNLLPYLKGIKQGAPHETLYWSYRGKMALRQGNLKLVQDRPDQPMELYDLRTDIGESKNLATKNPIAFEALRKKWMAWKQTMP